MKSLKSQRGWWNFVIPAVASLAGGMLANKSNEDSAQGATDANMRESALNRDFQERMSNTQYQRGMADMKDAGLNPMLAYSQGGASAPTGNTGSAVAARHNDVISPAVASAQQARLQSETLDNMKAQNDLLRAQRDKTAQETINLGTEQSNMIATNDQIRAATRQANSAADVNSETLVKVTQEIAESKSREDVNKVERVLKDLSIAEAKTLEAFYKTNFSDLSPIAKMVLPILQVIISGARR